MHPSMLQMDLTYFELDINEIILDVFFVSLFGQNSVVGIVLVLLFVDMYSSRCVAV